jgi:hypothetical protein
MERALETIVIDTNILARIVVESDKDRRENGERQQKKGSKTFNLLN